MGKMKLPVLFLIVLMLAPQLFARMPIIKETEQQTRAGVCKINITPPLTIPLGGYANRTGPATGVRDSLYAAVIVFDDGKTRAAIVTLDIIQVKYKEGQKICRAIEEVAGINENNVIINASHTHGSPWLETDSVYCSELASKTARAVKLAGENMHPVSIAFGEGLIDFNVNRRKQTGDGRYINTLNPEGVTDHRVKVLRIDKAEEPFNPLAVLFHVVCHPNVFRWQNTRVTADFPGEAKLFVEKNFDQGTTALFLQGCAGDIRANLPEEGKAPDEPSFGRNGTEADMRWCGWSAGTEVVKTVSPAWYRRTAKATTGKQSGKCCFRSNKS